LDKPANSIDISERGLVGVGMGRQMQVLRHAFTNPMDVTYLTHEIRTPNAALSSGSGATAATRALLSKVSINTVRFRPLEDVLCAGHSHGITAIIVPGSGEPNFDTYENNPFVNTRQRREAEVQNLLNKLSPDLIGMDTGFVGTVEKDEKTLREDHQKLFNSANNKVETDIKVGLFVFSLLVVVEG
jgi:U3 small nucleolar RNA-associated protein 7